MPTATVNTDSSAAKGICGRRGLGKVRHIDVGELWVQDKVKEGALIVKKVPGTSNLSDMLTKHVGPDILNKMTPLHGGEWRGGRSAATPLLKK